MHRVLLRRSAACATAGVEDASYELSSHPETVKSRAYKLLASKVKAAQLSSFVRSPAATTPKAAAGPAVAAATHETTPAVSLIDDDDEPSASCSRSNSREVFAFHYDRGDVLTRAPPEAAVGDQPDQRLRRAAAVKADGLLKTLVAAGIDPEPRPKKRKRTKQAPHPGPPPPTNLSAYELQRMQNIDRNQEKPSGDDDDD